MTYTHTVRYLRVSQKKLGHISRLVRGHTATEAIAILSLQPQKGAKFIAKAIGAAKNNATQGGVKLEKMVISSVAAQKGPIFMRRWIKPKGRSTPKRKPTSHANILFIEPKTPQTTKATENGS